MAESTDAAPQRLSLASLGIQSALLEGDPGLAYGLVADLLAEGIPFEQVLFDVLAPMQRDVGARWLQADYRIAQEHAASAALETVVALLAGAFDMPEDGTHVVVACAEGDVHSLPARMVSAYLTYLGWRVTFLGATLPAADLGAFLAEEQPAALLLSCAATHNLLGARACVAAAHEAGVPVVAGGRAFGMDPARARAIGADHWVNDPRRLDALLDEWAPDPVAAESGVVDDGEAHALAAALPALVEDVLGREVVPVSATSVRTDLHLLGEVLAAAVLVDDPAIVAEYLDWHRARHRAHRDVIATDALVRQLASELPPTLPRVAAMLAGA